MDLLGSVAEEEDDDSPEVIDLCGSYKSQALTKGNNQANYTRMAYY
jgi:hypothetical protein